jgi:hypothetical protein
MRFPADSGDQVRLVHPAGPRTPESTLVVAK